MMHNRLFALAGMMPLLAYAAGAELTCPLLLSAEAVKINPPPGWTGTTTSLIRLTGGGVMRGPPDGGGHLVPDSNRTVKWKSVTDYTFGPGEEKWLVCVYGHPSLQLAKRLDDAATRCEITTVEDGRKNVERVSAQCTTR